jgi:phosphosulfolactate synthase (CoM biosynthesis protein A)
LKIEKGNIKLLKKYKIMFAPTGTFQEIAMANDWHDDYMKLADDFDNLYEK